jgi:hypothetical protein
MILGRYAESSVTEYTAEEAGDDTVVSPQELFEQRVIVDPIFVRTMSWLIALANTALLQDPVSTVR